VNDFGAVDGEYFLVMEYVDGMTLVALMERCTSLGYQLPIPLVAFLGAEVGSALGYAHSLTAADGKPLDVVHRDVSPQNVMISFSGDVKLADFGIAKAVDKLARTEAGLLVGKTSYMSPEQARGDPIDGRSDLFALGVVLWEALALEPLLPRGDAAKALEALDACSFDPPSAHRDDVPREIDAIVAKALRKSRDDRYPDGETMARALRALVHRVYTGYGRHDVSEYLQWVRPDAEGRATRTEPPKLAPPPEPGVAEKPPEKPAAAPPGPSRAGRWLVPALALAVGLVLGGGAALTAAMTLGGREDGSPRTAAVDPGSVRGTPDAAPVGTTSPPRPAMGSLLSVVTQPPGAQVLVDGMLAGESPVAEQRADDRPVTLALMRSEAVPLVFPAVRPSTWTEVSPVVWLEQTDRDHGIVVVRSALQDAVLVQGGQARGPLPQTVVVRWEMDGTVNPQDLVVVAPARPAMPVDLSAARPWEVTFIDVGEE
jgi:hypothetical protein